MTNLPAAAVTATAKSAPLKAARSQDAPNEVIPGQDDQGQFQQALTREMGALQGRTPGAKGTRIGAEPADSGKRDEAAADAPEATGSVVPSLVALLNGAMVLPAVLVDAIPLAATIETTAGVATSMDSAVALTPGVSTAIASMGTATTTAGTATTTAGTDLAGFSTATANTEVVRASPQESQIRAGAAPDQAESLQLRRDALPDRSGNVQTQSAADSVASASAAAADSAAAGKILPDTMSIAAPAPSPMTQAAAAAVAAHLAASGRDRVQGERTARRDDQQSQAAAVGLEPADVDPGQTAFTIGKDKAGSAVLERVATDKFLHAGRDLFEFKQGASLETRLVQQHAAEAALPAGMNLGAAAPAPVAQAATATIAAHLAAPGWDRALGEKVVWMAGQKMQVAELHLNPPELGPLQITLTLSNDQASAQFVSQHAAVRDAIETAMPRLREMLAEGGIMLGNTSVSAESFGGQAQAQPDARSYIPRGAPPAETGAEFRSAQAPRATRGLVDIFA